MSSPIKSPGLFPKMPTVFTDFVDDDRWFGFDNWVSKIPAANIEEKENAFVIELAAPGKAKKDFKIDVENGNLIVSSEKKEESETKENGFTRKEYDYRSFSRSFMLPESVNETKINASYKEVVLKLELPKHEKAKRAPKREIEVS